MINKFILLFLLLILVTFSETEASSTEFQSINAGINMSLSTSTSTAFLNSKENWNSSFGYNLDVQDYSNFKEINFNLVQNLNKEERSSFAHNSPASSNHPSMAGPASNQIPEPRSILLFGAGLLGLSWLGRKVLTIKY